MTGMNSGFKKLGNMMEKDIIPILKNLDEEHRLSRIGSTSQLTYHSENTMFG